VEAGDEGLGVTVGCSTSDVLSTPALLMVTRRGRGALELVWWT
jgi:hypothetical protein